MLCSVCGLDRDKGRIRTIPVRTPSYYCVGYTRNVPIDICWTCFEEIMSQDSPIAHTPKDCPTWGRWFYRKGSLGIYPGLNSDAYAIELTRLDTHWKVLHWVNHLIAKSWVTKKDIADFCTACRELRREGTLKTDKTENFDEYAFGC